MAELQTLPIIIICCIHFQRKCQKKKFFLIFFLQFSISHFRCCNTFTRRPEKQIWSKHAFYSHTIKQYRQIFIKWMMFYKIVYIYIKYDPASSIWNSPKESKRPTVNWKLYPLHHLYAMNSYLWNAAFVLTSTLYFTLDQST